MTVWFRSGPVRVSLLHCSGQVVLCDGDGDVRKEIIPNLIWTQENTNHWEKSEVEITYESI